MTNPKAKIIEEAGCQVRVVHLERLARARRDAPPRRTMEAMARIFHAMGDTTRLGILTALLGGEMCVCDLAAFTGASDSAVSHQLRRLKDLALVRSRREGQVLFYSLDDEHVSQLIDICLAHAGH